MKKIIKNAAILIILVAITLTGTMSPIRIQAATKAGWKTAYNQLLNNPKTINTYYDFSYIKLYFGKYSFQSYFLQDIDQNGVPELFMKMDNGLSVVMSYSNEKLVCLGLDDYYRINTAKHELIVYGHWHGAGGSGDKEWSIYKINGKKLVLKYYIDKLDKYTCYNSKFKLVGTKKLYKKVYNQEIKNAKKISNFKYVKISNHSVIDNY